MLGQINEYINDARHIASNPDTEDKTALAQEIKHTRDQVLALSNSKYGSNYIFSGYQSDTQPFNQSSPYDYVGDSGSHQVIIGDGITVEIEADGEEMFVDQAGSGDSLFQILENLETAIAEPFDADAAQPVITDVVADDIDLVQIDAVEVDAHAAVLVDVAVGDEHIAVPRDEVNPVQGLADDDAGDRQLHRSVDYRYADIVCSCRLVLQFYTEYDWRMRRTGICH